MSKQIEKVIRLDYTPHSGQALFHSDEHRFRIVCCVPPETVMAGDYKSAEEIEVGDRVFNRSGGLQRVVRKFEREVDELVEVNARYVLPLRVTEEHPFFVTRVMRNDNYYAYSKGNRDKKTEWVALEEFEVEAGEIGKYIERQDKYEKYCLKIPFLRGVYDVDGWELDTYGRKYKQEGFPLNEDTAWVCGLYVADGSNGRGISFHLGQHEIDVIDRVKEIFGDLGYHVGENSRDGSTTLNISSIGLSELFERLFGKYAENKRIPDEILRHKDEGVCVAFLKGYFDGDGCFSVDRRRVTGKTNSRVLIEQLQLMIARFEVFSCLWSVERSISGERRIKSDKMCYGISVTDREFINRLGYEIDIGKSSPEFGWKCDSGLLVPLKSVSRIPYDGKVYNISTEDETFFVNNVLTHNCGRKWGKTTMLVHEAFHWLGRPETLVWWVAPYYNLAQLGWRRFKEAIPKEAIAKFNKKDRVVEMINGSTLWFKCYDSETEVLTRFGFKRIAEITKDDDIATLNEDGIMEYQKPINLYEYDYEGDMYRLKTRFLDLFVTPNHKLYVKPRNKDKFGLYEARDVFGKRLEHKRNCEWIGEEEKYPDEFIEFLGYYITEGHCEYSSVRITQKSSQYKRDKIERCIKKLGYDYTVEDRGFNVRSRDLRDQFEGMGKTAPEKRLPNWALQLNKRQLKILFDAMILGDGHKRKTGYPGTIFYTTSKKLADQFQEIILKLGYSGTISTYPPTTNDMLGYTIHSKKQYHISVSKRTLTPVVNKSHKSKDNIERYEYYKGKVYCLEVPNHVILVRRNGKIVWCGNSADSPDSLVGEGIDLVIIDEAARVREHVWLEAIRPNLSDPGRLGHMCMASTPRGHNWFYKEWLKGMTGVPEYKAWGMPVVEIPITGEKVADVRGGYPSWSNPHFMMRELESALKLPERVFLQEYCGRFLEDLGAVFRGVIAAMKPGGFEPPIPGEEYYVGVDLGKVNDWTVITVINSQGHVVSFERFREASWPKQVREIIRICEEYNDADMMIDSTGLGDPVYDFIRLRYPYVTAVKFTGQNKKEIIENLAISIQTGHFTYPDIPELIEELSLFGADQTRSGNIRYEAPEGFHDDCVISAALACWANVKVAAKKLSFAWI